jgi:hypothetical protein
VNNWTVRTPIFSERARVRAETLLRAAVANNARWCDAVCRSHGRPGTFTERMWVSARHAVPFYPNAITPSPDVTAAETGADRAPSRPYGVKDSFARLFQPALLDDPRCAVLVGRRSGVLVAGAIAYTAARVTGISNVFKTGPLRASTLRASVLWASALEAVAALRPGLPVVGYEHGEDLVAARQAGCRILGRLRVWTRDPDVSQP